MDLAQISIIIIGLNEEKNLDRVFQSLLKQSYPIEKLELIYVDSGSEDRSVEIAKKYTSNVFVEKSFYPTAARGRNRGLIAATSDIVHFVDGDVEIGKHYLKQAVNKLLSVDDLAAVTGYIAEKNISQNFLNKVFSEALSNHGEGFTNQTKAGGTYKKKILLEINGYDERIKLGEETELGERILEKEFQIYQINEEMGRHDYDFSGVRSLFARSFAMGKSFAIQSLIEGHGNYWRTTKRRNISNIIQNIFFILIFTTSILTQYIVLLYIALLYIIIYPILKQIYRRESNIFKAIYFFLNHIMKPVIFLGQLSIYLKLMLSSSFRNTVLVEKQKL